MTDIRTRLADALHRAMSRIIGGVAPDGMWAPEYLADVLLALPGIAIVELPEPDGTGGITQETWRVGNLTVETMGDAVLWPTGHKAGYGLHCDEEHSHNGCQSIWARRLAAALLAAANAAEAVEVPYVHDEEMVENKI